MVKVKDDTCDKGERVHSRCMGMIVPVRDALDIINGKWKLPIIISLSFGNKRFSEIAKEIPGITDKMLSKELRDLEVNQLVKRTVYDAIPVVIEYSMTPYGKSLDKVIESLCEWGTQHRKRIMRKDWSGWPLFCPGLAACPFIKGMLAFRD